MIQENVMRYRWVRNVYDPSRPDARQRCQCDALEDEDAAWRRHLRGLEGMLIGPPRRVGEFTAKRAAELHMVGVYDAVEDCDG